MKFWTTINGQLIAIEMPVSRFVIEESKIRGREKPVYSIFAVYDSLVDMEEETCVKRHRLMVRKEEIVTRRNYLEALEDLYSLGEKLNKYEKNWEV